MADRRLSHVEWWWQCRVALKRKEQPTLASAHIRVREKKTHTFHDQKDGQKGKKTQKDEKPYVGVEPTTLRFHTRNLVTDREAKSLTLYRLTARLSAVDIRSSGGGGTVR